MSQAVRREENEYTAIFQAFLEEHHKEDIVNVLMADDPSSQYCVVVNVLELFDSNIEVSQKLLADPNKMLPLFDGALAQAAVSIMQESTTQISMSFKAHLHVRLSNLPICPELRRDKIPKTSDIGRFLAISGELKIETLTKEDAYITASPPVISRMVLLQRELLELLQLLLRIWLGNISEIPRKC